MKTELKELQKENDRIVTQINEILDDFEVTDRDDIWSRICELIENEVEQEKFCGE